MYVMLDVCHAIYTTLPTLLQAFYPSRQGNPKVAGVASRNGACLHRRERKASQRLSREGACPPPIARERRSLA
jgi:hypothetical protein